LRKLLWMGTGLFLSLAIAFFNADQALAQTEGSVIQQPPQLKQGLAKLVTLDADDSFLPAILSILAEKSGFNIVTGPGVNRQERISVHIKDTPIEEAINLVVRAAGLSYEIVGNSFLVADPDILEREIGLSAHVYNLQYANANEIKELLSDLTQYVQVDTSGNRILVLASPKVASEISEIIKRVDLPPLQVLLEARLIEVATDDLDEYGIDWERLSHLTTILAESPLNPDGSSRAPTVQPPIEGQTTAPPSDFSGPSLDALPPSMPFQKIEGFDNIGLFSRQLNAFDITLDFLLKRNKAKLLAHSKLTTVNNRAAMILIGETLRWAVVSERNAIVQVEEIGIRLNITPTINSGGYITTKVEPEVSSVIELVQGIFPHKKIRTASTTVLVKDGQKIFIGGLLSVDDTRNEYRMPLLSDIPLIGRLFTHTEYSTRKTDLIIEITPRILRPDVSYSAANNFTSDGYQIAGPGEMSDFKAIEPDIYDLEKVDNLQKDIREFQNRVVTPGKLK
jgi:type II secretory pathway component GspD/PulD (secretin)